MHIVRHDSATGLLGRAGDVLRAAEAENNLILGICGDLDEQDRPSEAWLLTVEDEGVVVGVAVMTPPWNLVMTRLSDAAVRCLIEFLLDAKAAIPGIAGPSPDAGAFARSWSRRTGRTASLHMDQRIYACEQVEPLRPGKGRLRPASAADRELLAQWCHDFHVAVKMAKAPERCEQIVEKLIERQGVFTWEDDVPVSCAAYSRETPRGVAINFVYTPPELRGRGYATSCVAALTQRQLEAGKAFCCLYTDLSNPTSNSIYQRIGYQRVCDAQMWDFTGGE